MSTDKRYPNITPEKWSRIQTLAAAYGIKLHTANGEGESFGVRLRWSHLPDENSLMIFILDPGYVTATEAIGFVDNIVLNA